MKDKKLHEYFSKMGRKAAKARMVKLSPEERSEIARKAVQARWARRKKGKDNA